MSAADKNKTLRGHRRAFIASAFECAWRWARWVVVPEQKLSEEWSVAWTVSYLEGFRLGVTYSHGGFVSGFTVKHELYRLFHGIDGPQSIAVVCESANLAGADWALGGLTRRGQGGDFWDDGGSASPVKNTTLMPEGTIGTPCPAALLIPGGARSMAPAGLSGSSQSIGGAMTGGTLFFGLDPQ